MAEKENKEDGVKVENTLRRRSLRLILKTYLLSTLSIITLMFSGIVESTARVVRIEKEQENMHFTLECDFAPELSIDQSVAHNGVCLTVVSQTGNEYVVTAMN